LSERTALLAAESKPGAVALEVPPAVTFAFVGAKMPLTITSYDVATVVVVRCGWTGSEREKKK